MQQGKKKYFFLQKFTEGIVLGIDNIWHIRKKLKIIVTKINTSYGIWLCIWLDNEPVDI